MAGPMRMFTPSPTPEEKSEDRSCRSDARGAGSPSPSTCDHRITGGTIRADRRGLGSTAECVFWLPPFTFRLYLRTDTEGPGRRTQEQCGLSSLAVLLPPPHLSDNRPSTRLAFIPPNPNELLRMYSTWASRPSLGM